MNINQHIVDNIGFYLSQESPEYAFLISGDWGSGKTYFIESLIRDRNTKSKSIIKISLFGVKSASEIDAKIFQELHPVLGSKGVRLAGNILKGALSMGFKVDLNSNGKDETTANIKLDKFSLFDLFSSDENKKEIVIVFDDVERAGMPTSELLGYINYLVEISKVRVILIANEKFMLECDDKEIYRQFKEKVIGKTFEIKHDHDEVISSFLQGARNKKLADAEDTIKKIHIISASKNLRKVKQSIVDFEYFLSRIDGKYLENKEFYNILVWTFFSLSMEVKKGVLDEASLRKNIPFIDNANSDSPAKEMNKRYFRDYKTLIYSANLWADIIFNGDFDGVNAATSKLVFFIEKEEKKQPDWVKLWNFRDLDNGDFSVLLNELESGVQNGVADAPSIYLHKLGLIIYFCRAGLSNLSVDKIKNIVKENIGVNKNIELWKHYQVGSSSLYNGTGYQYLGDDDPDFIELKELVVAKANKIYEKEIARARQKKTTDLSDTLLASITNGNLESLSNMLVNDYETTPILNKVSYRLFTNCLLETKNSTIKELIILVHQRYAENRFLDGRPVHYYLASELIFWQSVVKELKVRVNQTEGLNRHILQRFYQDTISKVIGILSAHQ